MVWSRSATVRTRWSIRSMTTGAPGAAGVLMRPPSQRRPVGGWWLAGRSSRPVTEAQPGRASGGLAASLPCRGAGGGAPLLRLLDAYLRAGVDRRRDDLCPLRLPLLIAGPDVSDPQVQEDRS